MEELEELVYVEGHWVRGHFRHRPERKKPERRFSLAERIMGIPDDPRHPLSHKSFKDARRLMGF